MAQIAIRAASVLGGGKGGGGGSSVGEAVEQIVPLTDAISHIMNVARDQKNQIAEQNRTEDNEFNIRKQFLENTVDGIREVTMGQYNIVICTDQERDDFQDLKGRLLPMDLVEVEVSAGKMVNFMVYVFETGKYLRHGKYEPDFWWWWANGTEKKFFDPAAMHVHFETAQPKKDLAAIQAEIDKQKEEQKKLDDIAAATKAAEEKAKADSAAQLKLEADKKAADEKAKAENAAIAAGTAPPVDPNAAPVDPNAAPVDPNAPPVDPNAAPADPNAQPVDPNADPNAQYDPNAGYEDLNAAYDPNAGYEDPNAAYQDPNAAYYEDPNAAYQEPNAAYDPNAGYYEDPSQQQFPPQPAAVAAANNFAAKPPGVAAQKKQPVNRAQQQTQQRPPAAGRGRGRGQQPPAAGRGRGQPQQPPAQQQPQQQRSYVGAFASWGVGQMARQAPKVASRYGPAVARQGYQYAARPRGGEPPPPPAQ